MSSGHTIRKLKAVFIDRPYDYVFNKPNPIFQGFFLVLLTTSVYLFFNEGWHMLPHNSLHRLFVPLSVILVFASFYLVCSIDPGVVTADTVDSFIDCYEYDYILFHPKQCKTCRLQKPARSKHCSICSKCIAGFDHHCPWINGCVGHYNHRWFLLFLYSICHVALYGFLLVYSLLSDEIEKSNLYSMIYTDPETGLSEPVSTKIAWAVMINEHAILFAVGLFAGMVFVVVFFFFAYHIYLVAMGETTNEGYKRSDLKADFMEGYEVWIGSGGGRHLADSVDEIKKNKYNRGLLRNFTRVLFPKSKSIKSS